MENTDIRMFPVEYPLPDAAGYGSASGIRTGRTATFVRLETDTGDVGGGESVGPPRSIQTIITETLEDHVGGLYPFDIASVHEDVYTSSYHYTRTGLFVQALSGIDIACWDLMGKATGRAINELLPGKRRQTVDAYASTMYFYADDCDPVPELREAKKQGFTGVKIKIGRGIQNDVERVSVARDTLGNDVSESHITWYEEPASPENTAGYGEFKSKTDIPVAGGEAHSGPSELNELLIERCVDIIQPDVCMAGGLTQAHRTAALASNQSIGITPNNWMSAIGIVASLHFASTIQGYPSSTGSTDRLLFEWDQADNRLRTDFLEAPIEPENGTLTVPTGPGLGITPDESVIESLAIE